VSPITLTVDTSRLVASGFDLTVWNSAAQSYGLRVGLIWWSIASALAAVYFIYLYRSFLEHVAVEKQQHAERRLGACGDIALHGQGAQELGDLGGAHLRGVALAVEEDVAPEPVDVGLLGPPAAVARSSARAHETEEDSPKLAASVPTMPPA